MKKSLTLMYLLAFTALLTLANANPVVKTMEEGVREIITLGERTYDTTVLIIDEGPSTTVVFNINGEVTPKLAKSQKYTLNDGVLLTVIDLVLNIAGEGGGGDIVTFSYSNYCGDGVCNDHETCSSCALDCKCHTSITCEGITP